MMKIFLDKTKRLLRYTASALGLMTVLSGCRHRPLKVPPYTFKPYVVRKYTPVKNQGHAADCWILSMLSMLESERLEAGDSVNFSVDYLLRAHYVEESRRYWETGNRKDFSSRGIGQTAMRLIAKYGLVSADIYPENPARDIKAMENELSQQIEAARKEKIAWEDVQTAINKTLNNYFPPLPTTDVKRPIIKVEALTSFTHRPFGERFALDIPDNRERDTFLNVPMDTLLNRLRETLENGRTAVWDGDTRGRGFVQAEGVAILPPNTEVSQTARQRDYEKGLIMDNHMMQIVGMVHNQHGERFYLLKNSWGDAGRYHGFLFMSEDYLIMRTMAVYLLEK